MAIEAPRNRIHWQGQSIVLTKNDDNISSHSIYTFCNLIAPRLESWKISERKAGKMGSPRAIDKRISSRVDSRNWPFSQAANAANGHCECESEWNSFECNRQKKEEWKFCSPFCCLLLPDWRSLIRIDCGHASLALNGLRLPKCQHTQILKIQMDAFK